MNGRRPTISSRHGIVAAAHPLAAHAGARLLAQGGNAFDAAAATAAALTVVEPFMSGLAGIGLATMWVADEKRVRVLDFIPPVPASFPVERFSRRTDLEHGALPIISPGNLAGWCELVRTYGRKSLPEVFAPAIALARDGFALAEFGASQFEDNAEIMSRIPALHASWSKTYQPDGPMHLGSVLVQSDLATTLSDIAAKGPEHFYRGPLGETVIAHLRALGGTLTMADLAAVKAVWREPIAAGFQGLSVHVPPPPCESFQLLLSLRLLDGLDLASMARDGADHLDLVYRAIRLAAGERIAHNNPSPETLAAIMSDASVAHLRRRLTDGQPVIGPTEQWMPQDKEDPAHTTSLSIADRDGNLVCLTQSLGSPFGSGVVVPGTGICMNNVLYWADVQLDSPNRSKPGEDIPICMAPSISLRDGHPVLALGTPGSYGILQTQAQAMVQYLVFGLPLQEAIEAPRARLWDGSLVEIENRVSSATIAELVERGHDARAFPVGWTMLCGGMQAVAVDPATGVFTGAADPRRDGSVATP